MEGIRQTEAVIEKELTKGRAEWKLLKGWRWGGKKKLWLQEKRCCFGKAWGAIIQRLLFQREACGDPGYDHAASGAVLEARQVPYIVTACLPGPTSRAAPAPPCEELHGSQAPSIGRRSSSTQAHWNTGFTHSVSMRYL